MSEQYNIPMSYYLCKAISTIIGGNEGQEHQLIICVARNSLLPQPITRLFSFDSLVRLLSILLFKSIFLVADGPRQSQRAQTGFEPWSLNYEPHCLSLSHGPCHARMINYQMSPPPLATACSGSPFLSSLALLAAKNAFFAHLSTHRHRHSKQASRNDVDNKRLNQLGYYLQLPFFLFKDWA